MNKISSRPKNALQTLFRLVKYFGKKKYLLFLVIFLVIYTSFANIFGTYYLGTIIDGAITNGDYQKLAFSSIMLIIIFGVGAICDFLYTQIMVRLSQEVLYNLRSDLF